MKILAAAIPIAIAKESSGKPADVAATQPKPPGKQEVSELERAILELPPQFVADIPIAKRSAFLASMRGDTTSGRLDVKQGSCTIIRTAAITGPASALPCFS